MESLAFLPASAAANHSGGPFVVIVSSREEFWRWLEAEGSGAEAIEVRELLNDSEAWGLAAQGRLPIPLDVVLRDPASEYSALYRLVDVNLARSVRVTIPAEKAGFRKALKLAAALRLPVRLLPGQPDAAAVEELLEAARFYLHDPMVESPVEFFHSLLAYLRGYNTGTLWAILEQDPAFYARHDAGGRRIFSPDFVETHLSFLTAGGAECRDCSWRQVCAGYFKWPDPAYDCAGVKRLFAFLQSAAEEIAADLAEGEMLSMS